MALASVYTWSDDLATGNFLIDSEHKELFRAIGELFSACQSGKGKDTISKTVKYVADYTKKHFSDEEQLQVKSKYPDYTNHHTYHETFKRTVADIAKKLETNGPTAALVGEVNSKIAGWLVTHIRTEDMKVAKHVKASGQK
jgi:hemerythrin